MKYYKSLVTRLTPHFEISNKQPLTTSEDNTYMDIVHSFSVVGGLMYVVVYTCPHSSQVVSVISRFMDNQEKEHWEVVKWILRYIKCVIYISFFFGVDTWKLNGFVNSDYVYDLDRQQYTKSYMFKYMVLHLIGNILYNTLILYNV